VLGDANFIKRLTEFDRDNLPERVVRQLQRVMADPQFTSEQVRAVLLLWFWSLWGVWKGGGVDASQFPVCLQLFTV